MDFRKHRVSCEDARNYDMVDFLSASGFEPVKIKGNDFWYFSPLRDEKTPSFKVNRRINRWYDFGEGTGGNLIDFAIRFSGCTVGEFLQLLSGQSHSLLRSVQPLRSQAEAAEPTLIIQRDLALNHDALIGYLKQRRISIRIAVEYCREIHYQIDDRNYFAIGFKNDAGGFELRNPYSKISSSPKAVTTIKNGSDTVAVFEGFFNFLSWLVMIPEPENRQQDYMILNSLSFFESARITMESYDQVRLFLDNDKAGKNCTLYAKSLSHKYHDESCLYQSYKDLNNFLCQRKASTAAKTDPPDTCLTDPGKEP